MIIISELKGTNRDGQLILGLLQELGKVGINIIFRNNDFTINKPLTLEDFFKSLKYVKL